jgi:hypothetical protein
MPQIYKTIIYGKVQTLSGMERRREIMKLLQLLEMMIAIFSFGMNTRQQSVSVRHHKRNSLGHERMIF